MNIRTKSHVGRIWLTGATLIDGTLSDRVADAVVLIENGKVGAIQQGSQKVNAQPMDQVMDVKGLYIIPGMFNLHDHIYRKEIRNIRQGWSYDEHSRAIERENDNFLALSAARYGLDTLRGGVTTVRDVGERSNLVVNLRRAIDQGLVTGPRLKVAVRPIVMTRGHGYYIGRQADGPAEVSKAAREQLKDGADFIKIIATGGMLGMPKEHPGNPQFTVEEIRAATQVAHNAGKRTTAHADATKGIQNAIEGGIDCIEHGAFLDDETIEMMLKKNIPLVPTFSGMRGYADYHRVAGNPAFADFVDSQVKDQHVASFRKAMAAHVKIGVGTDTATLVADELEDMNEAGMPAKECLVAATSVSAEIVGIEKEAGTLKLGQWADLVVLGSDPWKNITSVRDVKWVMKAGNVITQDDPIL